MLTVDPHTQCPLASRWFTDVHYHLVRLPILWKFCHVYPYLTRSGRHSTTVSGSDPEHRHRAGVFASYAGPCSVRTRRVRAKMPQHPNLGSLRKDGRRCYDDLSRTQTICVRRRASTREVIIRLKFIGNIEVVLLGAAAKHCLRGLIGCTAASG